MPIYHWVCPLCGLERDQECRVHELERYTLFCEECQSPMKREIVGPIAFGNATEIKKQREGQ